MTGFHSFMRGAGLLTALLVASALPAPAGGGASVPLTVTPDSLVFTIPLSPATLTARVQYSGLITASADGDCASVAPTAIPASKPQGSSVYVAQFQVTPEAEGNCTIVITDKKGEQVRVPVEVRLGPSHLYIVAHQDDDLLFMHPDIQRAIAEGHRVTTAYVTAGSCYGDTEYYLTREAGVMAAYARTAGVPDDWILAGRPIREISLVARPEVTLVFFRLSASAGEAGDVCLNGDTNLRGLWNGEPASPPLTMKALDDSRAYTRDELIAELAFLLRRFHPTRVGTLDSTGLFGEGRDPSGLQISYPALGGNCYYYDHSDHFFSAVFARAARDLYAKPHEFLRYRGYNQANEPANVGGSDLAVKVAAFEAYGEHDFFVPDDPPFGGLYDPWLERQYEASAMPAPEQPLCP